MSSLLAIFRLLKPSLKEPSATLDDVEIGPPLPNFGMKPHEHMQMIVHHRDSRGRCTCVS